MFNRSIIKIFLLIVSIFVASKLSSTESLSTHSFSSQKKQALVKDLSSSASDQAFLFEIEDEDTDDDEVLTALPLNHTTFCLINLDNVLLKACTSFQYNSARSVLCSLAQLSTFRI